MARFYFHIMIFILCCLTSCSTNKSSETNISGGDTITAESELLTIVNFDHYTIVDIKNPWQKDALLQRYILVNRDNDINDTPKGIIVKTPLKSSLVYSSVHAGVIKELGAISAVTAVCDAEYFKIPEIADGLNSGKVIDAGSSMSPSIERILEHQPEAILTSPFQNAGHGAIEQLEIPIIECADYMESTPLGRAEWIKLLGELYGCRDKASEIYNQVRNNYNSLASKTSTIETRPIVISEMVTDGVWYLPGGRSYMARIFNDAGAKYPWDDDQSTGSLQLDFAAVYNRAHNADFWFIKTFDRDLTLDELKSIYPLHSHMDAFSNGGVYSCNTATSSLFEDFPFHPDKLLQDFINIIHPELSQEATTIYYKQVK